VSSGPVIDGLASESPARELDELIMARVHPRFAVSVQAFVARVLQLAQAVCTGTDQRVQEQALRLSLDDLYLATACISGEEAAWRELSTAHFGFMREFARRFVPAQAARDVADEVFAELWSRERLRQYGGRSTLRTWLGTVVAHAALNSRQAMGHFVSLDTEPARDARERSAPQARFEAESEQAAALLKEMVSDAVNRLGADDRLLLQLYYEQEMTLDELGVLLRASAPAISRRLKRAREALRAFIEAQARRRTGESADALRAGLDLGRIELDLGKLLGGRLSKQQTEES
jgi:RNA polymerase sigma-70 factor, ECF subfamily